MRSPEPVEVKVGDQHFARGVAVADAECRARDPSQTPSARAAPANERGLSGPQLAAHEHDVAITQVARELRSERFGLSWTVRFHTAYDHPQTLEPGAHVTGR